MRWFGPVSSVFDIVTYAVLFFWLCPAVCGGTWAALDGAGHAAFAGAFQTGWLMESMITQVLAVQLLRTNRTPFLESHASPLLTGLGIAGIAVAGIACFTSFGAVLDLTQLPVWAMLPIGLISLGYAGALLVLRRVRIAQAGSLL